MQLSKFVPTLGTLGKGHAAGPGQGGYEIQPERCVLRYESILTFFSLWTQQIELRLVEITIEYFST